MDQNDNQLNNERLVEQLMSLTKRVYGLEQEVSFLKKQLGGTNVSNLASTTKVEPVKAAEVKTTPVTYTPPVTNEVPGATSNVPQKPVATYTAPVTAPKQVQQPVQKPVKAKKNMESNIGKNLMGVIASLLILLSFILFAVFAFPLVSDAIKLVILYAISIGFGGFGILKMNKKSSFNALFMTFAGIGVSGFYVVSLIGTLVFNVIPDLGLVGLILLWLVATVIISKYKSRMFMYICNVGLIVSSFLMFINWKEILVGLVMYYVGGVILCFLNKTEKHSKDMFWIIQLPVMSVIYTVLYLDNPVAITIIAVSSALFFGLQAFVYTFEDKKYTSLVVSEIFTIVAIIVCGINLTECWKLWGAVISAVIMLGVAAIGYIKFNKNYKIIFTLAIYGLAITLLNLNTGFVADYLGMVIFAVPFVILGYVLNNKHLKYIGIANYLIYVYSNGFKFNPNVHLIIGLIVFAFIFALVILERIKKEQKGYFLIVDFYLLVLASFALMGGFVEKYIGTILFAVPFIVAGYFLNSKNMKYVGIAYYVVYAFIHAAELPKLAGVLISVVIFAGLVALLIKKYSKLDKYILTVVFNILMFSIVDVYLMSETFLFVVLAASSVFMNTKYYRNDLVTKVEEKASLIISYVYNAIIIFAGTLMIANDTLRFSVGENVLLNEVATLLILIAITLVALIINVSRMHSSTKHEILFGVYNCLKFTIFLLVVLNRFEVVPMIISIIAIVVAIGCIVLGFMLKKKAYRIYGLVLTIVFVFKLCLVDISFDSDIMRPIGFFIAGILCLAISWIYSKIEKTTVSASEAEKSIEE